MTNRSDFEWNGMRPSSDEQRRIDTDLMTMHVYWDLALSISDKITYNWMNSYYLWMICYCEYVLRMIGLRCVCACVAFIFISQHIAQETYTHDDDDGDVWILFFIHFSEIATHENTSPFEWDKSTVCYAKAIRIFTRFVRTRVTQIFFSLYLLSHTNHFFDLKGNENVIVSK